MSFLCSIFIFSNSLAKCYFPLFRISRNILNFFADVLTFFDMPIFSQVFTVSKFHSVLASDSVIVFFENVGDYGLPQLLVYLCSRYLLCLFDPYVPLSCKPFSQTCKVCYSLFTVVSLAYTICNECEIL